MGLFTHKFGLLETSVLFIGAALAYLAILATIGSNHPRVGIRIAETINTVIIPLLFLALGAVAALTLTRNYISDPQVEFSSRHRGKRGPRSWTCEGDPYGFKEKIK